MVRSGRLQSHSEADVYIRRAIHAQHTVASADRRGAYVRASSYDASKVSPLFRPALNASGVESGPKPVTGELVPGPLIGAFVPGVGDPFSGIVHSTDPGYQRGFIAQQGIQVAPRFGFAYDVFGTEILLFGAALASPSKLFGYDNYAPTWRTFSQSSFLLKCSTAAWTFCGNPPASFSPGATRRMNESKGAEPPTISVSAFSRASPRRRSGRYLRRKTEPPPDPAPGSQYPSLRIRFLPQSADPTAPTRALPDRFLRPYPGYSSLPYVENSGTANYNGLQVGLNRRFSRGVLFGVAYTWSKNLGYAGSDFDTLPRTWRAASGPMGHPFDQTNMFVVNYVWTLPKASKLCRTR